MTRNNKSYNRVYLVIILWIQDVESIVVTTLGWELIHTWCCVLYLGPLLGRQNFLYYPEFLNLICVILVSDVLGVCVEEIFTPSVFTTREMEFRCKRNSTDFLLFPCAGYEQLIPDHK